MESRNLEGVEVRVSKWRWDSNGNTGTYATPRPCWTGLYSYNTGADKARYERFIGYLAPSIKLGVLTVLPSHKSNPTVCLRSIRL